MSTPPLAGIRVIEFAGIGPGPFAGMMLADHGAEVIRIDRPVRGGGLTIDAQDSLLRNRKSIGLDLKNPASIAAVRRIVQSADAIIEGFRPGVMERLGLGPDVLLADNPKLVYGRMTGWGQTGPMAPEPGHDINYIAISGALHAVGRAGEKPTPPINLVGDRLRDAGRVAPRTGDRRGPGGRCSDDRRVGGADVDDVVVPRDGAVERCARHQFARYRGAFLRHL